MYTTIVVGTDGSDTARAAVGRAAELAREWGGTLHLVSAFARRSGGVSVPMAGAAAADSGVGDALSEKVANEMVAALADELGGAVATHVAGGDPADVLLAVAAEVGADILVVGSKGMNRRLFGSVPNSVAHGASCDVLVVKTT